MKIIPILMLSMFPYSLLSQDKGTFSVQASLGRQFVNLTDVNQIITDTLLTGISDNDFPRNSGITQLDAGRFSIMYQPFKLFSFGIDGGLQVGNKSYLGDATIVYNGEDVKFLFEHSYMLRSYTTVLRSRFLANNLMERSPIALHYGLDLHIGYSFNYFTRTQYVYDESENLVSMLRDYVGRSNGVMFRLGAYCGYAFTLGKSKLEVGIHGGYQSLTSAPLRKEISDSFLNNQPPTKLQMSGAYVGSHLIYSI